MGRDRNGALTWGQGWGRSGSDLAAKIRQILDRIGMGIDFDGGFARCCRQGLVEKHVRTGIRQHPSAEGEGERRAEVQEGARGVFP
jgi:hypothetical protein